jgi:ABC-type branched-subunit amino acid transport system substrate-binding protein
MKAAGVEVPVAETFAATQTDFRQTLLKFKEARVDALLVMGYTSHYRPIFRQMMESDMTMPVLGGVATPLGTTGTELPLTFLSHVVFPGSRFYYAPEAPSVASFTAQARAAGITPNYEVAYAFDYATTLLKATDAAAAPSAAAITEAIKRVTPFEGVTGTIAFDSDRDIVVDLRPCTWTNSGIRTAD